MNSVPGHIILFDGYCNLCSSAVQFILKRDKAELFYFASLQSAFARDLLQTAPPEISNSDSIVYVRNRQFFHKSTAALQLSKQLGAPLKYAAIFLIIPAFIRDFVYDIIARYRYRWFGKKDSCMIPTPQLKRRFLE